MKAEHKHVGAPTQPCVRCGLPARRHRTRAEHSSVGDPCTRCGLSASKHRARRAYHEARRRAAGAEPRVVRPKIEGCIAIDGEGYTDRATGAHHYCYIVASSADGLVSELWNGGKPLDTGRVLQWLCALPEDPRKVMFAAQYDWTKWLERLPNVTLFRLWRPEERSAGQTYPRPVKVDCTTRATPGGPPLRSERYSLNMLATRLTIRAGRRRVTIWDMFKFFDSGFVQALEDWGVGSRTERRAIARVKKRRERFTSIGPKERAYCRHETRLMAQLANVLDASLKRAGFDMWSWFGPGSIAAAMLHRDNANAWRPQIPEPMTGAVDCAFFGGHFELSRCGPVPQAHAHDLASAYAAAEAALPCLVHGRWRRVRGEANVLRAIGRECKAALVRYALPTHAGIDASAVPDEALFTAASELVGTEAVTVPAVRRKGVSSAAWGPFPFRSKDQSIFFPVVSAGGWVWHYEFLAAKRYPKLWPNVRAVEAWVLQGSCGCGRPFFKSIVRDYTERLRLGSDSAGMVLKKGLAARCGKRSQGVGAMPDRCLATAGLIMSRIRAAILDAIGSAPDPWDVVSVSTDGIIATRRLRLKPIDADVVRATARAAKAAGDTPLGAWKHEPPCRIFLIRPGQRFGTKQLAARGTDRKVLEANRSKILAHWRRHPQACLSFEQKPLFWGARMSINDKGERSPNYGRWVKPPPFVINYSPLPKRPLLRADNRLWTWALFSREQSARYDHAASQQNRFVRQLQAARSQADAQPDGQLQITT